MELSLHNILLIKDLLITLRDYPDEFDGLYPQELALIEQLEKETECQKK